MTGTRSWRNRLYLNSNKFCVYVLKFLQDVFLDVSVLYSMNFS